MHTLVLTRTYWSCRLQLEINATITHGRVARSQVEHETVFSSLRAGCIACMSEGELVLRTNRRSPRQPGTRSHSCLQKLHTEQNRPRCECAPVLGSPIYTIKHNCTSHRPAQVDGPPRSCGALSRGEVKRHLSRLK